MEIAAVNGVELEVEVVGAGEPVLLISPVLAEGLSPLTTQPALAGEYQLIHYHRRGWLGSTHTPGPVTIEEHALDAAALLGALGIARAHVVGHSSGGAVGAQLALDHPERVATLSLLELSLLSVPAGKAFLQQVGPVFDAFGAGHHEEAVALFMSAASGMDWPECHRVVEQQVPGIVAQAVKDADTFFAIELPSLLEWQFGVEEAGALRPPVLSVLGTRTERLWWEVASFLRQSVPDVAECSVPTGHLLQLEDPAAVAEGIAQFLRRHPLERAI